MGTFNYSRLKYFDKHGRELLIKPVPHVRLSINNHNIPEFGAEYAFVNGDPLSQNLPLNSSMLQLKAGSRFNITDSSSDLDVTITITKDGSTNKTEGLIRNTSQHTGYTLESYPSSNGTENTPIIRYNDASVADRVSMLSLGDLGIDNDARFFPTYTFESRVNFDKISTGLIETQTIYVLVENENDTDDNGVPKMTSVMEYAATNADASSYINRFQLFFFIDCREQKDFRMFHVKYDEMEWSDRTILDFRKDYEDGSNDNGYSVHVGFMGENDGVYEQKLYVCVLDTSTAGEGYPGDVYPVGEILMCAETEGEDERYRAFFTNFGVPDPKEYDKIFNETDMNEDLPDFESVNRHSKKLFLAYSEIFPYVGSYKALINAVKFLGYEDEIFFKEWYKEIGNSAMEDSGYTTYEITYGSKIHRNVIQSVGISERIHLRKMNWLSMLYRMSIELDETDDLFGFPQVMTNYRNFNTDKLMKLFGLKNWLEKYIIGVNCHIIDIGGEGLVFERYNLQKFGAYQKVIDYTHEGTVSPVFKNSVESMIDGSANINVELYPCGEALTIEDCENLTFADLCEGYFNESGVFCKFDSSVGDNSAYRYFGKTFEFNENIESVTIRTRGTHDSFIYNSDTATSDIYQNFASIIIDNNDIQFDVTHDFNKPLNSPFKRLPFIEVENGIIKRFVNDRDNTGELQYYANIYPDTSNGILYYRIDLMREDNVTTSKTYWLDEIPTLLPPTSTLSSNNVVITPPSRRLGTDNTVQNMIRPYATPYTVNLDPGTDPTYYPQTWYTNYGLRFCIDNAHGMPCFKIIGYEEKQIMLNGNKTNHFPKLKQSGGMVDQYEYFLEIINGRMIFPSVDKDYVSVINFEYDPKTQKRRIYVTTYNDTYHSSIYTYMDGKTAVSNFVFGGEYSGFLSFYDIDPEHAVVFNNIKSINVTHAGDYEVTALSYDKENCIFSKKAEGVCKVMTPSADLIILTADSSSNNAYEIYDPNASYDELSVVLSGMNSQKECLFGYEPKLQIDTVNGLNVVYEGIQKRIDGSTDFGTLHTLSKKDFSLATISSMSDRFDIPCYTEDVNHVRNIGFVMIRRTTHTSHLFCDSSSEMMNILSYMDIGSGTVIETLNELTQERYEVSGTMMDATLFVYNTLSEYPMYSTPGVLMPISNSSYDEYRFMPLFQLDAYDIIENFIGKPNISFYVIPTWTIPVYFGYLSSDINTLGFSIPFYPFSKTLKNESMGMIHFRNSHHQASNQPYFGHGSYRIIDTEIRNGGIGRLILYASVNPDPHQVKVEQRSFDGSTWFSPNSMDFMEYRVDVSSGASDNMEGYFGMIDNAEAQRAGWFIDPQYSVSLRDFDTMYAMQIWDWDTSIYGNTSDIETQYSYGIPVCINAPYVSLIPKINDDSYQFSLMENTKNGKYSIEWRIYKRIDGMNRRLVMKCKNKVLHLKLIEAGVYDIEYDYYDRSGNKYTKKMYNAITYMGSDYIIERKGRGGSLPYSFEWSDHVCAQNEIMYTFKWRDHVCALEDLSSDTYWEPI